MDPREVSPMFPEEKRQDYRNFLITNVETLSQVKDAFSDQDKIAFRDFLTTNEIVQECSNLKINPPSNIKDTDEEEPGMVDEIDVDKTEDTGDEDRTGDTGVKLGDSIPKKVK